MVMVTKITLKSYFWWLVGVILIMGVVILQKNYASTLEVQSSRESRTAHYSTRENAIKVQFVIWKHLPDFGYKNLLSDWFYLRFLQYFGDNEIRQEQGYALSPDFFEAIVSRDPYYVPHYLFLSVSSSIYAGLPERTVALMNQGLQHMMPQVPDQGYLVWRYKGTDELLFIGDPMAAQKSFQTAANWASQYSDPQSQAVAQASAQTAQFLADNPISKRAQIDAWVGIFMNSFDEQTQRIAIDRISGLGGRIDVDKDGGITIQYPRND